LFIKKPQHFLIKLRPHLSTRNPTNIELYYARCEHYPPPRKAFGSGYIDGYKLVLTVTTIYNSFYI